MTRDAGNAEVAGNSRSFYVISNATNYNHTTAKLQLVAEFGTAQPQLGLF